jgi:hypothetical protein
MNLLIPALLLAAVFWHPWTHIGLAGEPVHAQSAVALPPGEGKDPGVTEHILALKSEVDWLRALRQADVIPALAVPAPQPAVPSPDAIEPASTALEAASEPGDLEALVCSFAWPCEEALAVARCESGTDMSGRLDDPSATNGTSYGLFQINEIHAGRFPDFWEAWTDPVTNATWAFELWSEDGWQPWSCQPY